MGSLAQLFDVPTGEDIYPVTTASPDSPPIGSITLYGYAYPPAGWLLCDGQAVNRTEYHELFSVIGTMFGQGDGATTFNLPDFTDRFPVGAGSEYATADVGGEATHTLTVDEMPSHRHYVMGLGRQSGSSSDLDASHAAAYYATSAISNLPYSMRNSNDDVADRGLSSYVGSSQSHNNIPPYLAIYYIIKAKDILTIAVPREAIIEDNLTSTSSTNALSANMGRVLDEKIPSMQSLLDMFHPVGSIYETTDSNFNPNTSWGGTWEQLTEEAYLKIVNSDAGTTGGNLSTSSSGSGDTGSAGSGNTGSTAITVDQMPSHSHSVDHGGGPNNYMRYTGAGNSSYDGWQLWGYAMGINSTGGGKGHTHTLSNHTHSISSHTHDINPVFYGVYAWHRTA